MGQNILSFNPEKIVFAIFGVKFRIHITLITKQDIKHELV